MHFKNIVEELGLDVFSCPVIIVAGTNGKGSCVSLLENIYTEAGYKVGTFYSPHLFCFNERIRVNKKQIDNSSLIFILKNISKTYVLSFFQYMTLAALIYFSHLNLDVIILEVGLGGRLDPVNAVNAHLSIITSIGLDHQNILGDTREKIAMEKAGIYKSKGAFICGDTKPPRIIESYANKLRGALYQIGKSFNYVKYSNSWIWCCPESSASYFLPTPSVKIQNAATVLMALISMKHSIPVKENYIVNGLNNTKLPGRFERFSYGVMDVSHNSESIRWLVKQILAKSVTGKILAIFAMLDDRQPCHLLKYIVPLVDSWYITSLHCRNGEKPEKIAEYLQENNIADYKVFAATKDALKSCIFSFEKGDFIIIFGSFHTVIEAKKIMYNL